MSYLPSRESLLVLRSSQDGSHWSLLVLVIASMKSLVAATLPVLNYSNSNTHDVCVNAWSVQLPCIESHIMDVAGRAACCVQNMYLTLNEVCVFPEYGCLDRF